MHIKRRKIAFIGAGKAGLSIGGHFIKKGFDVCGFYDINFNAKNMRGLKKFTALKELVLYADIIFITAPDCQISKIWTELKKLPLKNKIICHTSGALSSQAFKNIDKTGAAGLSAHPLYALSNTAADLDGATFVIEGGGVKQKYMRELFKTANNPVIIINPKKKILYHAACVMASNLVSALLQITEDLFKKANVPPAVYQKLFFDNASNVFKNGLIKSLTGPVERGDATTIRRHIKALRGSERNIYVGLSKILLSAAKLKNPRRDYRALEKELK
jgi:predicted short-subunit dehydrogenase-like oxidoreductase (DUF2520 family)